MGLAVYDNNGQIDLLGSATAFYHFGNWAREQGGELAFFGEEGYTEKPDALFTELKAKTSDDPFVAAVRERLLEMLPKAYEILIVSES